MLNNLTEMLETEIENRAQRRAAEILAAEKSKKPELPVDVTADGTIVRPFLICGVMYLTRKDTATLLGVQLPALWRWNKDGVLTNRKLGNKVFYAYDEVKSFMLHGTRK